MANIFKNAFKGEEVKVLFPIGVKLLVSFALVLLIALLVINALLAGLAYQDLQAAAGEYNSGINGYFALEAENNFNLVRKDAYFFLDFIRLAGKDSSLARQASAVFFERSWFIAAICVPGFVELINEEFFASKNINPASVSSWISAEDLRIKRAAGGEPVFTNPSLAFGHPLIAMFYPWHENNREETAVILFSPDGMADILKSGGGFSFIANDEGEVILHSDFTMIIDGSNVSNHPLFTSLSAGDDREISTVYTEKKVKYLGAGKKLAPDNLMAFTFMEYKGVIKRTASGARANVFLIIAVLAAAMAVVWFVSKTIFIPIQRISDAVSRMEGGQFDFNLEYSFPDELGVLSDKITKMGRLIKKLENLSIGKNRK